MEIGEGMRFRDQLCRPFIILGMHRSGSSMLSRIVNRSGVFMGLFQEHNAEALRFLKINQLLLKEHGASWIDPLPVEESGQNFPDDLSLYREHFKLGIESALYRRWLHNHPWGWKDPRNTFTLGYWLGRFPKAQLLHIHRDGRQVAMSLLRRNERSGEVHDPRLDDPVFGLSLWERYMEQMEIWRSRGIQLVDLEYADLSEARSDVVKKLQRAIGGPVRVDPTGPASFHEIPAELEKAALKSPMMKKYGYL